MNNCLSACLQRILNQRGISRTQEDISKHFPAKKDGHDLDLDLLQKFLQPLNLSATYYNPSLEPIEADIFIKDALERRQDIIIAYNFKRIQSHKSEEQAEHVSLLTKYNALSDLITLWEPEQNTEIQVPYSNILASIDRKQDNRYGFYTIF